MKIKYCVWILCGLAAGAAVAGPTNEWPKFDEVYQLLRAHLNGASEAELNRAAVEGLLAQLKSGAMLAGGGAAGEESPAPSALGKSMVYDDSYAYFRVLKVDTNLAGQLMGSYRQMAATNKSKIKGVVLDLRFAGGTDYAAAAAAADCFLNADQPLLECRGVVSRSTKKDNAITVPLAALINAQTSEAAEGLAAVLRQTSTGLLLGSESAGRASVFQEFPLSQGGKLRIAVGEIKLGDGAVFRGGIQPDIAVKTNPEEEKAYWEHPYQVAGGAGKTNATGTNVAAGSSPAEGGAFRRFNEAELVREQRDGADLEAAFGGGQAQTDPNIRIVRDPVLARALDLLKGLAVVQKPHPG
ncbi:MAG: S41 family peptidase [Verrucomicrobiota bacterium]